jgi:hypothetical protein
VPTPEQRQPSDNRGHPADRRVFEVSPDAWDAMQSRSTVLPGTCPAFTS